MEGVPDGLLATLAFRLADCLMMQPLPCAPRWLIPTGESLPALIYPLEARIF
jgi:hypothetical protein